MRVRVALGLLIVLGVVTLVVWRGRATPAGEPVAAVASVVAVTVTSPPSATPSPVPPSATPRPTATAESTPRPVVAAPPRPTAPADAAAETLDALRRGELPARDLLEIARRFGKIGPELSPVVSNVDPAYPPGTQRLFRIANLASGERLEQVATLRARGRHANWWVADGAPVDQAELEATAARFDERTYPTNRALIGEEWSPGIDGDPRINVFIGEVPGVGGYYSSADQFPRAINPFSNEMEIVYINVNNARPGQPYFDGILAHEFQHMIHWTIDRNEDLWINEGLSELAATLNGFPNSGSFNAFLRDPDIPLTRWSDQTAPFYGSAYLFAAYFEARYGREGVRALVAEPADGPAGFDALLGPEGGSFDALFADWSVALLLDDPAIEDGRYALPRIDAGPPAIARRIRDYPAIGSGTVNQYGIDYIALEPSPGSETLEIEFEGAREVALLPIEPSSGGWMIWSNTGDDADTHATRRFDLRGLDRATLEFDAWYDLEVDYDYAYIALSTDGGERWTLLRATESTDRNPNGNSFGPAFTGRSGAAGSAGDAVWRRQTVDLTPFVGQEVLLRFEQITDDAINHLGIAIDRVTIPELDYSEDFEMGDGGWTLEGFARVGPRLPQHWLVQAAIEGRTGVERRLLEIDESGRARTTIPDFGGAVSRVTLIVSGATPQSAELATYAFNVQLR